jgi:hypothetical protein
MKRYRFMFELELEDDEQASTALVAIQEKLDISPIEVSLILGCMEWPPKAIEA